MREEIASLRGDLKYMQGDLEYMQKSLGHVLDLYLDPWENIHSETKS